MNAAEHVDASLLELIRCPETKSALQQLDSGTLAELNQSVDRGELFNRLGLTVKHRLDEGLVNEDRSWCYPVRDGIVVLIVDEAIPLGG